MRWVSEFATAEEVQQLIDEEESRHESMMEVYETFLENIENGNSLFHDKETDKWFLVEKGKLVPLHLQEGLRKK